MGSWNQYLFPLVMLSDKDKYTVPLIIKNMTVSSTGEPINYGAIMLICFSDPNGLDLCVGAV